MLIACLHLAEAAGSGVNGVNISCLGRLITYLVLSMYLTSQLTCNLALEFTNRIIEIPLFLLGAKRDLIHNIALKLQKLL